MAFTPPTTVKIPPTTLQTNPLYCHLYPGMASPNPPPASAPSAPLTSQKDKLSRALGAAFLAHQVSELERSVDSISFSRDPRLYQPQSHRSGKKEVRVVDASALVYALPVLKRWIREDSFQLVVPLQAISVLDMLKKGPTQLQNQAREATKFLETQLAIAKQLGGEGDDPRIRLRAQKKGEELSWEEVGKMFQGPAVVIDEVVDENEEFPPPPPSANDIPKWLRSTIQCALYFSTLKTPSSIVSHSLNLPPILPPPPQPQLLQSHNPSNSNRQDQQQPLTDFFSISSGDTLSYYFSTYFSTSTPPYEITSSEILEAREWTKSLALAKEASNNSRGGGRGGRSERVRGRGRGARGTRGGGEGGRGGGNVDGGRKLFVP